MKDGGVKVDGSVLAGGGKTGGNQEGVETLKSLLYIMGL